MVEGERWAIVRPRRDIETMLGEETMPDWL
jgi:hypothetical protein